MRDVTIRCRADGIIELSPRLAPLKGEDRVIVVVTVLLVTGGLFLSGALPPAVAGVVMASCVVGDAVLAVKRGALALFRPVAEVLELPSARRRRSGTRR